MTRITGIALGILAGVSTLAPSSAEAVRMGDTTETTLQCQTGTVSTEGYSWTYKTCWTVVYTSQTPSWELDSAYEWDGYGGGGGGGAWQQSTTLPTNDPTLTVSVNGKKAWSTSKSCSDEDVLLTQAVQVAALASAYANGLVTGYPAGHQITLFMPGGERQSFVKNGGGPSAQFLPTTTCGTAPTSI